MSGASFKVGTFVLSDLGDYGFWSREIIGGTPEDTAAADAGVLSIDRQQDLAIAGIADRDRLDTMDVPGVRDWMPPARRLN